jgi:hypothetical protein
MLDPLFLPTLQGEQQVRTVSVTSNAVSKRPWAKRPLGGINANGVARLQRSREVTETDMRWLVRRYSQWCVQSSLDCEGREDKIIFEDQFHKSIMLSMKLAYSCSPTELFIAAPLATAHLLVVVASETIPSVWMRRPFPMTIFLFPRTSCVLSTPITGIRYQFQEPASYAIKYCNNIMLALWLC